MHKITREAVRKIASSDRVYFRGMRYYAAHAVTKVIWSEANHSYKAVVNGSNSYNVSVGFSEENGLLYECNCPARIKQKGACKHVVATMLFISDYQQREYAKEHFTEEDKTAYQIIEYFRKREYKKLTPIFYRLELHINVYESLKSKNGKAFVSFYAGNSRMYKIPNTKKFIEEYYQGKTIDLGKEFHFVPEECAFEPNSVAILDYLKEIYEIQETLGKTYYSNLFNRQEMVVSKDMLMKLLSLCNGINCSLELGENSWNNIEVVQGNPTLNLDITMEEDKLTLVESSGEMLHAISEDGTILLYDHVIYLPDQTFLDNLLPLFSALFTGKEREVMFRGELMGDFIEKVLPVLKKTMSISMPESIKNHYVVEPIEPQLYLDLQTKRNKPIVNATVTFKYGEYEVNPLEDIHTGSYILVRDYEEEERLMHLVYDNGFNVSDDHFVISKEEEIFYFMSEAVQTMQEEFTIFYSKDYRKNSISKQGRLSGGVRINTDINLLQIDLDYGQIPEEELKEFFKSIRLKKKYYRLKNGTFVDLNNENKQIEILKELLEIGEVDQDGNILVAKQNILDIEELIPHSSSFSRENSYKKIVADIKNPEYSEHPLPEGMDQILRDYQKVGYRWLKTLSDYGMGGVLADDMGLGKTLQTICYISGELGTKTLIVCPTSLAYNWEEEFNKFAPYIRTCIVTGTPEERKHLICNTRELYDVWITTYPLIRKDIAYYKEQKYDAMFIDEAQFIKNPTSLAAKAVKGVQANHRFALTGTPIENSLSELWSIFDFVMPGFLWKYSKFLELYEKPIIKDKNDRQMDILRRKIKPFVLRRMKKDVLNDLPDKIETRRTAYMGIKQRKIYESYLSRIQLELEEGTGLAEGQNRIQVLAALTRLRQICCHPGTFVENYNSGSGKLELLMEQLPDILSGGHSVIVFSQFTSMLNIIGKELKKAEIPYYYLAGSTSAQERRNYVKSFNEGEVKVFLISLKAGGTGLNLTGADTVIHFDPWWNPAVEDQATDRAYRIGQKRKVQVIKYVMKDSIEEKIYELQKQKKHLSDQIIQEGEYFVNKLSDEEIRELFH